MSEARPWLSFYGSTPATLDYPDVSLYEALASTASYRQFLDGVDTCASALASLGLKAGDRFFYFSVRLKRMIKSSGFNVYPAQVERVKAFVVLKDATRAGAATEQLLIEHCRAQLIKWACPRDIEFRTELPTTRVGKVDYRALTQAHTDTTALTEGS